MSEHRPSSSGVTGPSVFEVGLFAYSWLALPLVVAALRLGWRPRLDTAAPIRPRLPPPARALRLVRWVDAAGRRQLFPVRCLPRAITVRHLLRLHGIPARLCIGVRREENLLAAHAWVESAGSALGETPRIAHLFHPLEAREGSA